MRRKVLKGYSAKRYWIRMMPKVCKKCIWKSKCYNCAIKRTRDGFLKIKNQTISDFTIKNTNRG